VDLIKITRVIDNLISNAIKYNRRNGKIEIILREDYLLISDSGVGIKVDSLDSIFDRL